MLALFSIIIGLALGALLGGSLNTLAQLRIHLQWLILPLFVLQGAARGRLPGLDETSVAQLFWIAVSVILVGSVIANWRFPGMLVAAVGITLNMLVVLLNQGMPVVLKTGSASGAQVEGFYHFAQAGDALRFLGDCLTLSLPFGYFLLSPGDVVLAVGVVIVIITAMRGGSRAYPLPPRQSSD
ncbi:MAG: DUF5317 family protein [Coriobacteriia bacterium]